MKLFLIEMYCRLSVPAWAGVFVYFGWLALKIYGSVLGIDTNDLEKELETIQKVVVYSSFIVLMIVGALAGCLISYVSVAKIFRVPEFQFRQLMEQVLTFDSRERLFQRYYYWCEL